MISENYRNAVTKSCAIQSWRGNMAQQRQHVVIQMDITLRLAKQYHAIPCPETGTKIKYGIAALRQDPHKLEKWYSTDGIGKKAQPPPLAARERLG